MKASVRGVSLRAPAFGAAALTVLFAVVYVRRLRMGLSNVDDYLYARQTLTIGDRGLVEGWRSFGHNSPLVPTLAVPLAALRRSPHVMVLVQLPLLLGLYVASGGALAQLGVPRSARWWGAAGVAAVGPVVLYAGMYSFALAAAAATVAALWAYLASDRLRRRVPTVLLGFALGALLLSRVVSPVYVVALLLPLGFDALRSVDAGRDRARRLANALLGVVAALVVAGPWWLLNGREAVSYLLGAGFDDASGFARANGLVDRFVDRAAHSAHETGWLLSVAVVALVVLAMAGRTRARLPAASALVGLVLLASSSNKGTAFALPLLVLGLVAAGGALHARFGERVVTASVLVAILTGVAAAFGVAAPSGAGELWVSRLPVHDQADESLGCACTSDLPSDLHATVLEQAGPGTVLVVRDDAVLNVEGLRFANRQPSRVRITTPPFGASTLDDELLADATAVVLGATPSPYHAAMDLDALETQVRLAGFELHWRRALSEENRIEIWRRS